jgi:hypothetical protein
VSCEKSEVFEIYCQTSWPTRRLLWSVLWWHPSESWPELRQSCLTIFFPSAVISEACCGKGKVPHDMNIGHRGTGNYRSNHSQPSRWKGQILEVLHWNFPKQTFSSILTSLPYVFHCSFTPSKRSVSTVDTESLPIVFSLCACLPAGRILYTSVWAHLLNKNDHIGILSVTLASEVTIYD